MSGEIAGTGRRFRKKNKLSVVEAVFQPGQIEVMSHYVKHSVFPQFIGDEFTRVSIDRVANPHSGWEEVTAGVPSPSTEEESHPALTAAAPPVNFVVEACTVAAIEGAYCCTAENCDAICCVDVNAEPDAEESIDEYVARIDEGVVPAAAVNEADNRRTDTRDAELALHRTFYTEALAAHAESSPNKVEVLFGRACDRLRRGLRELAAVKGGEAREEDSASSQTVGPPPVAV